MSGSKPKLKVRTLDEMLKKISESSENDPEQLAHTSENSPALSLSETDSEPVFFFLIYVPAWKFEYMRVVPL
jgi:hypothetical protein